MLLIFYWLLLVASSCLSSSNSKSGLYSKSSFALNYINAIILFWVIVFGDLEYKHCESRSVLAVWFHGLNPSAWYCFFLAFGSLLGFQDQLLYCQFLSLIFEVKNHFLFFIFAWSNSLIVHPFFLCLFFCYEFYGLKAAVHYCLLIYHPILMSILNLFLCWYHC